MLKRVFSIKSKESLHAHNALIKLDEADSAGKGRKFKSRFITPGLAGYPDQFGNVLIQKETFDKFINSMVGVPVVIRHKDLTQNNADDERVGVVSTVWFDEKDGWYWCDGIIWDETAINLITVKGWSVSCSYDVLEADDTGGTWNNTPYDMEFLNGVFTHLALVDNPRYEKANIVFNSKTILNNKFKEEEHPRDEDGKFIDGENSDTKRFNKEIDKIKSGEYPRGKQITVTNKPSKPWLEAGLQDKKVVLPAAVFHKATVEKHNVDEDTIRNFPELLQDPLFIFKSSTESNSFVGVLDAVEKDVDIEKPLIVAIKPVQDYVEVNIITSTYGKDKDFIKREIAKGNLLYKRKKTISNSIVASIATESLKSPIDIITNSVKDFNPKSTNIKEHEDMTLIEEIKKLIYKAENEKGDSMKKANNEDVDKREILREADAIAMKPASDFKGGEEEKFRTLTKKLEELSYNKSERGTSDNEKEDDDDTKADNESEKDEEEYEELKKEVKEEAGNKKSCKNSIENSKPDYFAHMQKIYNSVKPTQEQSGYIPRSERLERGKKY